MSYFLGVDSETAIELFPEWDYKAGVKKIKSEYRTQGGKYYQYQFGSYTKASFGLNWVDASDAGLINLLWAGNSELLFFVTSDTATQIYSVMIMNDELPLGQFNKPYDNYYKGKIELATY